LPFWRWERRLNCVAIWRSDSFLKFCFNLEKWEEHLYLSYFVFLNEGCRREGYKRPAISCWVLNTGWL
jgi:hypothetical protein